MKRDISTREDVVLLVDSFYDQVLRDPLLAPHFAYLDFEAHKPKMVHFWSFALLGEAGYTTNVFDKHTHLQIGDEHFARWVELFLATVDTHFAGENAESAKLRARSLGWTFASKMKSLNDPKP